MFQTEDAEKIKTHISCSKNRAVNEAMWKNIVGPGRPQVTV
jgi:hypothetical protein